MLDDVKAQLLLRNRALSVVVAQTVPAAVLAATTTGYARTDGGSFLTEQFYVGQEIVPAGFVSNPVDVIIGVTASTMTTANARTAEAGAGGRTLTVTLPQLRAWENVQFQPVAGRPYVEDAWAPATMAVKSYPVNGGLLEETGLYVLRWYGLADTGISAVRNGVRALQLLLMPGSAFDVQGDGSQMLRVRSDVSASRSQALKNGDGWAVVTLKVPWRAWSINVIAP